MAVRAKYVLFVHGIGPQEKGYSDELWTKLWDGPAPADTHKFEVFYYDEYQRLNEKFKEAEVAAANGVAAAAASVLRDSGLVGSLSSGIQDVITDCISHVFYFVALDEVRQAFCARMQQSLAAVRSHALSQHFHVPDDIRVTVISHSLGTMVAYITLHDVVNDSILGLPGRFYIDTLYTMATPLELMRRACNLIGKPGPNDIIRKPTVRPRGHDLSMPPDEQDSNICYWYSYRHANDHVASRIPLTASCTDSNQAPPFVWADPWSGNPHDFLNYISHARGHIQSHIGSDA